MLFNPFKKFEKEIQALKNWQPAELLDMEAKAKMKQRILHSVSSSPKLASGDNLWPDRLLSLLRYVVAVLVGLSVVGGTVYASNTAVPGMPLYPVKLVKEQMETNLAFSDQAKAQVVTKHAQARLEELEILKAKANVAQALSPGDETTETPAQIQAEKDANTAVGQALTSLAKVQKNFQNKGNQKAATTIGAQITRLKIVAKKVNAGISGDPK